MGGARPKVVVDDDNGLRIAKFNRPDDPLNNARVEHAMLNLARACGLSTAESRLKSIAGRESFLSSASIGRKHRRDTCAPA